jgi:hypothetical protein
MGLAATPLLHRIPQVGDGHRRRWLLRLLVLLGLLLHVLLTDPLLLRGLLVLRRLLVLRLLTLLRSLYAPSLRHLALVPTGVVRHS